MADVASSTVVSPEQPEATKPAEEKPAGYESPKDVASASEASPESLKETAAVPAGEQPAGYEAPKSGETEASPEAPAAEESAPAYGTAVVPGVAPTAAPYPQGNEASPVNPAAGTATGTIGAAMPTGTGSVTGTTEFEGAASTFTVGGLFVSIGAIAAFFM